MTPNLVGCRLYTGRNEKGLKTMSKYIEAANLISDLLCDIMDFFHLKSERDIKLTTVEDEGLVLQVVVVPSQLASHNLCDTDFSRFCNEKELSGVMFFNADNTLTFSMTPKKA